MIKEIEAFNPDKIVISLSNTFDFIWHSQIRKICMTFPSKIILQSNFNDEHLTLPFHQIEECRQLINSFNKIIFASNRNKIRF